MKVEIPEKNITVEFPDGTSEDEMVWAIQKDIFGKPPEFEPDSSGFDYNSAYESGNVPQLAGDGKLHFGSLDSRTGMVLKGKKHQTWDLMEAEEQRRGNKIVKKEDGRYYSVPDVPGISIFDRLSKAGQVTMPPVEPEPDALTDAIRTGIYKGIGEIKKVDGISKGLSLLPKPLPQDAPVTGMLDYAKSPHTQAFKETAKGLFLGDLPEGLGYLQKPAEAIVDKASQYFQTVEEESAMQLKHPNWMAARYALASLLPAGEELASAQDREAFSKLSPEEQSLEIIGETVGWALLPALGPTQRFITGKLVQVFPWLAAPLKSPSIPNWLRRLTNRERGLVVQGAERQAAAGATEEEITAGLNKYWKDHFAATEGGIKPEAPVKVRPKELPPPEEIVGREIVPTGPKPKGPKPEGPKPGTPKLVPVAPEVPIPEEPISIVSTPIEPPASIEAAITPVETPETYKNPALQTTTGKTIEVEPGTGGHIAIANQLEASEIPGIKKGMITSEGKFVEGDFTDAEIGEMIGKEVKEIKPVEPTPAKPVKVDVEKEPAKKLWEMDQEEFDAVSPFWQYLAATKGGKKLSKGADLRKEIVQQAQAEGKTIPPGVLKDYPELITEVKIADVALEPVTPEPIKPQIIGRVYLDKGGWKDITSAKEVKRGPQSGKTEVTLLTGKKIKVDAGKIRLTEPVEKAEPVETQTPAPEILKSTTPVQPEGEPISLKDFTPIPTGKTRSDIIKKLSSTLNVPIRVGKFRQVASGIYKKTPEVIRLKRANDIETAIHEVGHHVQELLGYGGQLPKEIRDMAYAGAKDINREGFAEFLRHFVTNESTAKSRAPEFYKAFNERLDEFPDIRDILSEAKEAWNIWKSSPSVAKVHSYISRGNNAKKRISLSGLYTEIKDSLHPVKKVVDLAKSRGHEFKPSEDPYIVSRLLRGWSRKGNIFLRDGTFQYDAEDGIIITGPSLREILKPVYKDGTIDLLDTYLIAKRAVSDSRISKGFAGQLSKADFAQTVMDLEPQFEEVAKQLYKYSDELITFLTNSGFMDHATAEIIREANRYYAPMYRLFDIEELSHLGKSAANITNPVKRLSRSGSARLIHSPTESLIKNTYSIINTAERQRIGNALKRISRLQGMGDVIFSIPFPMEPRKINKNDFLSLLNKYGDLKRIESIRTSEAEVTKTLNELASSPSLKMENVVREALTTRGWTNSEADQIINRVKGADKQGKKDIIQKTIERTTILMVKEELDLTGLPDEVIHTFRPAYRAGPGEIIIRENGRPKLFEVDPELKKALDSVDSADLGIFIKLASMPARVLRIGATTFSTEFPIRNPLKDQWTAFMQSKFGYTPGIDFIRGAFHILNKTDTYLRFGASGAAHSNIVSMDREYLSKNLRKLMESKFRGAIKNPLELIRAFAELTEEATRVGEFARGQKKLGRSREAMLESGLAGREVSVDFGRLGGAGAKAANLISAFWNARLEGLDKMARTHKERPGATLLKAFLGITLPTMILWWKQKDDKYYNELPAWRRTLAWNYVQYDKAGKFKRILWFPKPFEWGLLYGSLPEAALEWAYTDNPDVFKETAEQIGKTLNILPIPTVLTGMYEWWAEKSWFFDTPTVPRGKEELEPRLQKSEKTSKTIVLLADMMDKIPGLREIASPSKLENLIYSYTGGAGRTAILAADKLIKTLGVRDYPPDPTMTLSDIPGIRAFVVRFPAARSRSIEQFYDKYKNISKKFESAKEEAGIRGMTRLDKELKVDRPQVLVEMEGAASALSVLRKIAELTYKDKTMSPDDKRDSLDNVYWSMINIARVAMNKGLLEVPNRK